MTYDTYDTYVDYDDRRYQPTRHEDLDERVHGLRGPQHNTEDLACRVATRHADGRGQNRCPICRPVTS